MKCLLLQLRLSLGNLHKQSKKKFEFTHTVYEIDEMCRQATQTFLCMM